MMVWCLHRPGVHGKSGVDIYCQFVCVDPHQLFLPRDASAERGDATVSRLSVRPSVTFRPVSATHRLELFENNFTAE